MTNAAQLIGAGFEPRIAERLAKTVDVKLRRVALAVSEVPPTGPVPRVALQYLETKNLVTTPAFDNDLVWGEEHAFSFTVARIMERDILADVKRSIETSLRNGETFEVWSKGRRVEQPDGSFKRVGGINDVLDKSGWSAFGTERQRPHRLFTIYRTNMRSARAVGQWQRIQSTVTALPFLEYMLGPSERHREGHVAFAGTIARADDAVWDTWMPPNGFGCKCHVRQLTQRAVDDKGGPVDPPPNEQPDPGFEHNPGALRAETLNQIRSDQA